MEINFENILLPNVFIWNWQENDDEMWMIFVANVLSVVAYHVQVAPSIGSPMVE